MHSWCLYRKSSRITVSLCSTAKKSSLSGLKRHHSCMRTGCSVLQCVAVFCIVLQCVAACIALCCNVLQTLVSLCKVHSESTHGGPLKLKSLKEYHLDLRCSLLVPLNEEIHNWVPACSRIFGCDNRISHCRRSKQQI